MQAMRWRRNWDENTKTQSNLPFPNRAYQGARDLTEMQNVQSNWIKENGRCGYEHLGDKRQ